MSAGVLQFALGITTGSFFGVMDRAQKTVGGLSKSFLSLPGLGVALGSALASISSLESVVDGMFKAIERGAELDHLSRRTGTSVASLYELQKGFKAVGLTAEDVGPLIFKLQKSLGGINDFGEDTRSTFFRIGLDIETLKRMDAPRQLAAISQALSHLNATGAASAASTIFGREGAANMVQLSRGMTDFSAAMAKAKQDADLYQRNADSFVKLQRGLDQVKNKTQTLFAGMAEGAAPAIQGIIDVLNRIDLSGVGRNIGKVFTVITEAFREGQFMELIYQSIVTGLELGFAALPVLWEQEADWMLYAFRTPLVYLQGGLTQIIEETWEGFSKLGDVFLSVVDIFRTALLAVVEDTMTALGMIPGVGKALGLAGFQSDSIQDIYNANKTDHPAVFEADKWSDTLHNENMTGPQFDFGFGQFGIEDVDKDLDRRKADFRRKMAEIMKPFDDFIKGLLARAPKPSGAGGSQTAQTGLDLPPTGKNKFEGTAFEKMGAIMGGHIGGMGDPGVQAQRQTATATQQMVPLLRTIANKPHGAGAAGRIGWTSLAHLNLN